jgi:hypothetical protein
MDREKPAIASPASFFVNPARVWSPQRQQGKTRDVPCLRCGLRTFRLKPAWTRPIQTLCSRASSTHLLRPLSRATQGTSRMEQVHPNVSYAATCAMIALALSGCRSSSNGVAGNPFMSPDRVPPPNTRALLPGQAQPYYQGDPLPAMQSTANQPVTAIAAVPNEVDSRSSSGRTLAWAQPGAAAPSQTPISLAPAATVPQPEPQTIAIASEASVAVPNDADPLRYPLPAPQPPETAAPIASAIPIPTQARPIQPIAVQPPQILLQASYSAPIPSAPLLPVSAPTVSSPQLAASPWRSPQVAQAAPPATYAPQPVAVQPGAPPLALPAPPLIPANTMAATLRAVESPPLPGDPIPRVRMPGHVASQASTDGFRPRTSMQ